MTSKEALELLKHNIEMADYYQGGCGITSSEEDDAIEIIEKDLERLDSPFRPAAELKLESMLKVVAVDEEGVRFFLKGE